MGLWWYRISVLVPVWTARSVLKKKIMNYELLEGSCFHVFMGNYFFFKFFYIVCSVCTKKLHNNSFMIFFSIFQCMSVLVFRLGFEPNFLNLKTFLQHIQNPPPAHLSPYVHIPTLLTLQIYSYC